MKLLLLKCLFCKSAPQNNPSTGELYTKLFDEVEKIKSWKVKVDTDTMEKERKLQDNKRTIENQRKAIQDLQVCTLQIAALQGSLLIASTLAIFKHLFLFCYNVVFALILLNRMLLIFTVCQWKSKHKARWTDLWKWGSKKHVCILFTTKFHTNYSKQSKSIYFEITTIYEN